ncbi:MAG: Rpn family recombination-promoting nuclease/putative transposase, partial [Fibromonadaceae bacterium]|nr:Rpn family recombination-promoting nuclease/putative transposase [Fibromonadaceae bacterium]
MPQERTLVSFDWAIKYLLKNKADYVILEGFLTTLLGKEIKIKSLSDSESGKRLANDKVNRVDVLAEEEDGSLVIVELQFTPEID